jgi:hypothetical protein
MNPSKNRRNPLTFLQNVRLFCSLWISPTAVFVAAMAFVNTAVAGNPPSTAPLSRSEIRQIKRVVASVTSKRILVIVGFDEDNYVPGAVTGYAYSIDVKSGKTKDRYTRTDLVSVIMQYTDRSHVDTYTVRKVHGRWKIQSKQEGFL